MSRVIVITCIAFLVASIGIGMVYYYVQAQQAQTVLTPFTAEYRRLTAEINISGTVKASETVNLAFKNSGIVDTVSVTTGEFVSDSKVLMTLRTSTINAQLSRARANLNAQLAILRDLEKGTRPEQIAVTQAELDSSETSLKNAKLGLFNALSSAQSAADVVVRFTIDNQFILNPNQYNSVLTVPISDIQLSRRVLDERRQIELALSSWGTRLHLLQNASASDLISASADMHTYLQTISSILGDLTQIIAMNDFAEVSTSQTAVTTARATITSADSALTTSTREVQSAQSTIAVMQRQLGLENAGPTSDAADAQRAIVESTRAQVVELFEELKYQSITAPFSGIITNVDAKQGETVVTGANAVSMIANGPLKIEGYVPEVHYGKIAVGELVRIQLDAFPGEFFPGTLGLIDPSATLRDGVPNFKVTVYFTNDDSRVRPGLTASAFIQTADKQKVMAIPLAAVKGVGDSATVMRLIGGTANRTNVVLGVTGTDGYVEIVSGLTEKDVVLVDETKQYRIIPN